MELYQAIALGIVQGLTEFLPISSSGHLVIGQHLFGLHEAELVFDTCLHVATLLAVIIYFRNELTSMILSLGRVSGQLTAKRITVKEAWADPDIKMIVLICVGTLPTVVIGLCFKSFAETVFSSLPIVGCALLVTGILLWITRLMPDKETDITTFSLPKSLVIGVIQGLSITPGISRSGSTIATGLYLGLSREMAARYSFLLSIPAICGAAILNIKDMHGPGALSAAVLIAGMVSACLSGYLALRFLVYIVNKGRLYMFAPYCGLLGLGVVLFSLYS